ncbi:MFS transporter [Agromyces sp. SYSU K20354]|uniref:MFS transporter n=1 Tax=Agromyces cavernae TaxID=2898659 RepID=UPI001E311976|nr:MFS transporter [Agromyces cavernae]MCD2443391.1 MFS transporter [Agromyces cavernae]
MTDRGVGIGAPLLAGVLVVGIGLSVRSPITSVSALLPEIDAAYDYGAAGLAMLSAVPVLLFGLAAPLAPILGRRLGVDRAAAVLVSTLAVALLLRPLGAAALIAGTVVVGASISLLGVLTPQLVRTHLERRQGLWSGMYTAAFGASAALGAGLAVPVFDAVGGDAATALLVWAIPISVVAAFALVVSRRLGAAAYVPDARPADTRDGSILRAPRVWSVTGFFGCQALIYFALTAWLPTIAVDRGLDPAAGGLLLAWLSLAGIPAALLAPAIAARYSSQSTMTAVVSLLSAAGIAGLAFAPVSTAVAFVAVLGVAQSAAFGLAVGLIVQRAPSTARTASFSAVAQGIGYSVAALGPLGLGVLANAGVGWTALLASLLGVVAVQFAFGLRAGRPLPKPSVSTRTGEVVTR